MLFGEIIEPSTRALIDEGFDEYPEVTESIVQWEGNSELPNSIDTLLFIETEKVNKLFHTCVLGEQVAICKLKNFGVEVFKLEQNKYVIMISDKREFTCGEITEFFDTWISLAKNVYTITSGSLGNYQNINLNEKPVSLIKVLSNDSSNSQGYDKLESPNLVSGLAGSVLTYCIHLGLKCTLFIAYVDMSPLDSINMGPLLSLLEKINIPVRQTEMKIISSSSNLYM